MDIPKILKYATCRVMVMLDTNQFDNSRYSVCTLLTFGPVLVCKTSLRPCTEERTDREVTHRVTEVTLPIIFNCIKNCKTIMA
jgi:hypothetical protein